MLMEAEQIIEDVFRKQPKQRTALQAMGRFRYTLLEGGSRSGKTFIAVYALVMRAAKASNSRHLILRLRFNHVKTSIWKDTLPKVLRIAFPKLSSQVKWNNSDYYIELPNGSQIWIGGLDDAERAEKILGTEYASILFEEANQMAYLSIETALTRLAQKVNDHKGNPLKLVAYYSCNPVLKSHWLYRLFHEHVNPETKQPVNKPEQYGFVLMNPMDNLENLSEAYLDILNNMSVRKQKRFRDGEWLSEIEGALWSSAIIERDRISPSQVPDLDRIVVGVDPSGGKNKLNDEQGIVGAGRGPAPIGWVSPRGVNVDPNLPHFYVLADYSGKYTPQGWGGKAVGMYHDLQADRIIGESNFGGDMVESTIRNVDTEVSYKSIHASRGKAVRAEPVAALSEQGRLHYVGFHPELEDECVSWVPGPTAPSPNRLDAKVWSITELMGIRRGGIPNIRSL